MDHEKQLAGLGHAERNPALFVVAMILIVDGERKLVPEYGRREIEVNAMLGTIRRRLLGVPGELIGKFRQNSSPLRDRRNSVFEFTRRSVLT